MPVVIALVAVLGAGLFWLVRLRQAGAAAADIVDSAQRLRGRYRRRQFLRKAESSPLAAVEDPAVAAVAMLIKLGALAPLSAAPSDSTIKSAMRDVMGLQTVDETFIFAQWVAGHASDADMLSLRFSKLWREGLDKDQRRDFRALAERTIQAGGSATPEQIAAVRLLGDRLSLT
ncbi:hypothetical protein [Microvirga antarctica]|uniref:hypothetical protein n=1 Tax=Microvirga antarctica TaxID=2819233 RepID=UPI001B3132C6|nr:hypothetical protein [Microvirga antarctica]